ncbi:hypothetical protein GW17_00014376 [Ensete ventricosum]|nr:hypothetical protein GW17_00014376 [Ensete ventricosum]
MVASRGFRLSPRMKRGGGDESGDEKNRNPPVHCYHDATCLHEERIINLIAARPALLCICVNVESGGRHNVYDNDNDHLVADLSGRSQPRTLPHYICIDVNTDVEWSSPSDPFSLDKLCTVFDHLLDKWSLLLDETITFACTSQIIHDTSHIRSQFSVSTSMYAIVMFNHQLLPRYIVSERPRVLTEAIPLLPHRADPPRMSTLLRRVLEGGLPNMCTV